MKLYLSLAILLLVCSSLNAKGFKNSSDIFLGEEGYHGYIPFNQNADMFYWLFDSRSNPNDDPLTIWLTGGPGCSSELALLFENGPFSVNNETQNLQRNPYAWNNRSNLLFVDQPVGTGYSRAQESDLVKTELEVAQDFYFFLKSFLNLYPQFKQRKLFITGESYAGHYIPAISAYLVQQNDTDIRLEAFAIGNGWVDPINQYPQYAVYAYENKIINQTKYDETFAHFQQCQDLLRLEDKDSTYFDLAYQICEGQSGYIVGEPRQFNVYDIRKPCDGGDLCYNFTYITNFLARTDVIQALNSQGRQYSLCNGSVYQGLLRDHFTNQALNVQYLLDHGVRGLVYSGDVDYICNWRGSEAWTHNFNWTGQSEFQKAEYRDYVTLDGEVAGRYKYANNLTFFRVYEAGHMVPYDKPQIALDMLNRFLTNTLEAEKIQSVQQVEIENLAKQFLAQ